MSNTMPDAPLTPVPFTIGHRKWYWRDSCFGDEGHSTAHRWKGGRSACVEHRTSSSALNDSPDTRWYSVALYDGDERFEPGRGQWEEHSAKSAMECGDRWCEGATRAEMEADRE